MSSRGSGAKPLSGKRNAPATEAAKTAKESRASQLFVASASNSRERRLTVDDTVPQPVLTEVAQEIGGAGARAINLS